jgi:hypothetical protein
MHQWQREAAYHMPKKDFKSLKPLATRFQSLAVIRGADSPEAALAGLLSPIVAEYEAKRNTPTTEGSHPKIHTFMHFDSIMWNQISSIAESKGISPKHLIINILKAFASGE